MLALLRDIWREGGSEGRRVGLTLCARQVAHVLGLPLADAYIQCTAPWVSMHVPVNTIYLFVVWVRTDFPALLKFQASRSDRDFLQHDEHRDHWHAAGSSLTNTVFVLARLRNRIDNQHRGYFGRRLCCLFHERDVCSPMMIVYIWCACNRGVCSVPRLARAA